jgi:glycosyltransferase involved in cell wall biosynthesis
MDRFSCEINELKILLINSLYPLKKESKLKRKIHLLYAPYNIASMPAITIDILNAIGDIEAKGVSISANRFLSFGKNAKQNWKVFDVYSNLKKPLLFLKNLLLSEYYLIKRILWSDIIIWQWDAKIYLPHYLLMKILNKPVLVEWVGSDIRIPDLIFKYSPYYKQEFENGTYTYTNESKERSTGIQKKFKFLNAIPLLCPEMSLFMDRNLFPKYISIFQRINSKEYQPVYPDINKKIPILVHTPTATGGKGTRFVRSVVENLKQHYQFEYIEIINKSHREALDTIAQADIFLDQFLAGAYGMASCEAMAMGKPVFCFLLEPLVEILPKDCPIVNADIDQLEAALISYIQDPQLRRETGKKSRMYLEKWHDAEKICTKLNEEIKAIVKSA